MSNEPVVIRASAFPSAGLSWWGNLDRDIFGYNVYLSTSSGGPYTKMNSSILPAWLRPPNWTEGGLSNGQAYYFVVTSGVHAVNESGFSKKEEAATPGH